MRAASLARCQRPRFCHSNLHLHCSNSACLEPLTDITIALSELTDRVIAYRVIAKIEREGPMAGGKFFALIDELKASEERLDALAEPLLKKLALTENAAVIAVEAKHATIDAAADYIKRMNGVTEKLAEGKQTNGGPTLPIGSAMPLASDEQAASDTATS
jgi:hypothetical protein